MVRVSLTDLRRKGSLQVKHLIHEDDPLWEGVDLVLDGPVKVRVVMTGAATGKVLASGQADAPLVHECRRCLERVDRPFEQPLELCWSTADQLSDDLGADNGVRVLERGADAVELGEAIREELVLAAPSYVLCREDCRGVCPGCGTNLNDKQCECVTNARDSRWDALRALKKQ